MRGTFHRFHHISPPFSPHLTSCHTVSYGDLVKRVKSKTQKYFSYTHYPIVFWESFIEFGFHRFHQTGVNSISIRRIGMVKSLVKSGEKGEILGPW
jgi:hypothetical protein